MGIMAAMNQATAIKHKAVELGLDLVGITDAAPIAQPHVRLLTAWLDAGYAGPMHSMHRHLDKRHDPGQLLPEARSVIIVGLNYKSLQGSPPGTGKAMGRVADYAQYEDYHGFLKARLNELAAFIGSVAGQAVRFKVCVDSVPLLERALAARAGLGFIARNHMLTHPRLGPQLFLGELITDLTLPTDEPSQGNCGDCDLCIRACPTGALRADGVLDASRCLNTWMIEHAGDIPSDLAARIGDRVYGCDECVTACPFQQKAPACANSAFRFYPDRAWLDLNEVLAMTEDAFMTLFAYSPIRRIGLERLQRSARICMENRTKSKKTEVRSQKSETGNKKS